MDPGACQYLIFHAPAHGVVPVSLFYLAREAGTVHGLYFGDAGSGTFEEAYFRMDDGPAGKARFLECDNPEDAVFIRNRARPARGFRPVPLSPEDARVFAALRACRQRWWTFGDGDNVRIDPARLKRMRQVPAEPGMGRYEEPLLYARSAAFDDTVFARVRQRWSLRGL